MKFFIFILFVLGIGVSYSQTSSADSSNERLQVYEEFTLPQNFDFKYRTALRRVRRVYPLALHAAKVIDSLENEIEKTDKTRKEKKIARQTHRDLKNDFKFLLKELYVSEGVVLSKLIYRETGMTVEEIIAKYKGDAQAKLYTGMASMFDQELDATYDANHEDFVLECVVQDIKTGKVDFDPTFEIVDRKHYREDRKQYKAEIRKNKKEARKRKREARREKRKEKKNGD
ncbi:MAG: DUF4294 domain-containing protein [Brumimicrobium sp.]